MLCRVAPLSERSESPAPVPPPQRRANRAVPSPESPFPSNEDKLILPSNQHLWVVAVVAAGCDPGKAATELPTQAAVTAEASTQPTPLYQELYAIAGLPGFPEVASRVRLLAWLRELELSPAQLAALERLRQLAAERRQRLAEAQRARITALAKAEQATLEQVWKLLSSGTPLDDPAFSAAADELRSARTATGNTDPNAEFVRMRLEGVRAILDAEQDFLHSLSPAQEKRMVDAMFALRDRLDPIAEPQAFDSLIGSIYEPGQYAVLARGTHGAANPFDIGGLWSEDPELSGEALPSARREVILFLVLEEPGLEQAIAAARRLAAEERP